MEKRALHELFSALQNPLDPGPGRCLPFIFGCLSTASIESVAMDLPALPNLREH